MGEGEPEPKLCEDQQADHWGHVSVTRPGLQRDGYITSTWITEEQWLEIDFQCSVELQRISVFLLKKHKSYKLTKAHIAGMTLNTIGLRFQAASYFTSSKGFQDSKSPLVSTNSLDFLDSFKT